MTSSEVDLHMDRHYKPKPRQLVTSSEVDLYMGCHYKPKPR